MIKKIFFIFLFFFFGLCSHASIRSYPDSLAEGLIYDYIENLNNYKTSKNFYSANAKIYSLNYENNKELKERINLNNYLDELDSSTNTRRFLKISIKTNRLYFKNIEPAKKYKISSVFEYKYPNKTNGVKTAYYFIVEAPKTKYRENKTFFNFTKTKHAKDLGWKIVECGYTDDINNFLKNNK